MLAKDIFLQHSQFSETGYNTDCFGTTEFWASGYVIVSIICHLTLQKTYAWAWRLWHWSFVTFTYLCHSKVQDMWKCPVKNRVTNHHHPPAEHWPGSPPCWSSLWLCFWRVWRYALLDQAAFPVLQVLPCVWQSLVCRSLSNPYSCYLEQPILRKEGKQSTGVSKTPGSPLFAMISGGLVSI